METFTVDGVSICTAISADFSTENVPFLKGMVVLEGLELSCANTTIAQTVSYSGSNGLERKELLVFLLLSLVSSSRMK